MKQKIRAFTWVIVVSHLLLGALNVQAADNIRPTHRVTGVLAYPNYLVVRVSPTFSTNLGCEGRTADKAVVIDWSDAKDADKKSLQEAVLLASTTGRRVGFGVDACHSWGGGTPSVFRVDIGFIP